jgi:hypothetical protein
MTMNDQITPLDRFLWGARAKISSVTISLLTPPYELARPRQPGLLGKAVSVSGIAFAPHLSPQLYYIRGKASWLAGLSMTASVQP